LAKCADFWLSGRHVANMLATFPAKATTERLKKVEVVKAELEKAKITESTITGPAYDLFRELNKRIVRRPYPIPKISTTLQELEGFTYAMALDLNMGYNTIRLDPRAVEMFTIIFPWGKYSHQR